MISFRFAAREWALPCLAILASTACFAKATVVTLSELTKQSTVIVYGTIAQGSPSSESQTSVWVAFTPTLTIKGTDAIRGGKIELCNTRPNTEWPDLSKMQDNVVLFLSKKDGCFNLSHNYRSVVRVSDARAQTGEIKGQPDDQPLDEFLGRLKSLVSVQKHGGH